MLKSDFLDQEKEIQDQIVDLNRKRAELVARFLDTAPLKKGDKVRLTLDNQSYKIVEVVSVHLINGSFKYNFACIRPSGIKTPYFTKQKILKISKVDD